MGNWREVLMDGSSFSDSNNVTMPASSPRASDGTLISKFVI